MRHDSDGWLLPAKQNKPATGVRRGTAFGRHIYSGEAAPRPMRQTKFPSVRPGSTGKQEPPNYGQRLSSRQRRDANVRPPGGVLAGFAVFRDFRLRSGLEWPGFVPRHVAVDQYLQYAQRLETNVSTLSGQFGVAEFNGG